MEVYTNLDGWMIVANQTLTRSDDKTKLNNSLQESRSSIIVYKS